MEAVEKGSDVDAAQKEKSSVGRFLTFFLAAILGGAIVAGFVAVTNGIVPARNEAAVQSSKKKVGSDFGGLEDVVFEFPSSSISKRQEASSCVSNISKDTLPSAQIVGAKPPFFFGMRTRNVSSLWYPITGPGTDSVWSCTGLGFVRGGVYMDKYQFLTVPVGGMYYIYSQLLIADRRSENFHRYYITGAATLKQSCVPNLPCNWKVLAVSIINELELYDSIFHAGVYKLEAGDKIGIQVLLNRELPPYVRLTSIHTYYGLFLIDR